jgi:hypothetical protein
MKGGAREDGSVLFRYSKHARAVLESEPRAMGQTLGKKACAGVSMALKQSFQMISEMKEFASFTAGEQRYVRRSIDVAAQGAAAAERWARSPLEAATINAQSRLYRTLLQAIRASIPDDNGYEAASKLIGALIILSVFDLGEGKLKTFKAYRFLYERLLGGAVRPWLPSAFLAASALPYIHPEQRKLLLRSMSEGDAAAGGWSLRDSAFFPEWVDKVPLAVS